MVRAPSETLDVSNYHYCARALGTRTTAGGMQRARTVKRRGPGRFYSFEIKFRASQSADAIRARPRHCVMRARSLIKNFRCKLRADAIPRDEHAFGETRVQSYRRARTRPRSTTFTNATGRVVPGAAMSSRSLGGEEWGGGGGEMLNFRISEKEKVY